MTAHRLENLGRLRDPARCTRGRDYFAGLPGRYEREAQHLANLTGWPIAEIREQMVRNGQRPPAPGPEDDPWWRRLWPKG